MSHAKKKNIRNGECWERDLYVSQPTEGQHIKELKEIEDRVKSVCLSLWDWDVPFLCDEFYIENVLYKYGRGCFFVLDSCLWFAPFNYSHKYNLIGYHTHVDIQLYNRTVIRKKIDDVVILENRADNKASRDIVKPYLQRFYDLNVTLDQNLILTRHPFIIKGNGDTNDVKRLFHKLVSGHLFVTLKSTLKKDDIIDVLNTQTSYIGSDILNTYSNLKSELCQNLGIHCNQTIKNERVTKNEVNNDSYITDVIHNTMRDLRQKAVSDVKDKLGFDITCREREVDKNVIFETERDR